MVSEIPEGDLRQETFRIFSGNKKPALERGAVEPFLLCGNGRNCIGRKYPQVYRTYFLFIILDTAFYREKLNENRFVIFIYYECRYAQFALSSTTIYLWLISLTASKELSILLLKLLKCMEQSVYRLIHLGLRVRCRD